MKVAIVCLGGTRDEAPFDDHEWELWGLPKDEQWHLMDRLFEMHDRQYMERRGYGENYWDRCRDTLTYMQATHPDIPLSEPYPLHEVRQDVFWNFPKGGDWFNSSAAYMLALAIYENAHQIGIWGVDIDDAHEYQRPNLEYLIGVACGRGIDVVLPESTKLCSFETGGLPYQSRYGYLDGDHDIQRA